MARSTPIDDLEQIIDLAAANLTDGINTLLDWYGNRPFLEKRLNDREQLEAYQALRNAPDGLYHYADGIRKELSARLADYSEEERIALGLGEDRLRKIAYDLTLKYVQRMNLVGKRLGIPIEGTELPLPPEPILGGEEWPDMMTSLGSTQPYQPDLLSPVEAPSGLTAISSIPSQPPPVSIP